MRRLSTRSRGDTLFLGWETPRSWSIGRCNTTPRLCCEICCDSLFLFPPLCCGQCGRGLSRGLALAARRDRPRRGWSCSPGPTPRARHRWGLGTAEGCPACPARGNLAVPAPAALGLSPPGSRRAMGLCSTGRGRVGRVESGNDLFLFSANHKHSLFSLGIQGSLMAWGYLLGTLCVL